MNTLYVRKETGTFTDTFECFGVASIIKMILNESGNSSDVLIEDKGYYYQISTGVDITDERVESLEYFDLMECIITKKNKDIAHQYPSIDYEKEKERRERFFKLSDEDKKKDQNPPSANYDLIRLLANIESYWKSYQNMRAWEKHFPQLIKFVLDFYSDQTKDLSLKTDYIKSYIKKNGIKIKEIGSLQDINPDKGKGVNKLKAKGITLENPHELWLQQLIRFIGVWKSGVSKYFGNDYKTYSLAPNDISTEYLENVFKDVKSLLRSSDSIKTDIFLLNLTTQRLIEHNPSYQESKMFFSPSDKISGLYFTFYKSLGQRPAVMNMGFIALPIFINVSTITEGKLWINLLNEHHNIVRSINQRDVSVLMNYRQFLSGSDFDAFFEFIFDYGSLLIRDINDRKNWLKCFTIKNMEVLMNTNPQYVAIVKNKGFKAVAEAIRNSTVVPAIMSSIKTDNVTTDTMKKDIVFGLSHRLKIASRTQQDLLEEISIFIQQYNERIMLKDYRQKQHKRYITTEELEAFTELIDEGHSPKLIAGLLVAFGYARDSKKEVQIQDIKEVENE